MTERKFLRGVYDLHSGGEVRDYYQDWAEGYDAEVAAEGYATPGRCAAALAAHTDDPGAPILDFACGTGLSGVALRAAGFTVIDGIDISAAMLAKAADKGVYRTLTEVPADAPPPIPADRYAAIAAIGAIGPGAAPASVIAPLVAALPAGGRFVLSLNDHALERSDVPAALASEVAARRLSELSAERGDHLPGIDVQSTVYVYART
ncbi:methyltransferase domain-containing protein [Rhodobacteraceae bacterium CCMM004]|nr:methyltransferase domain-containing protein [Rhodobacteraceae bacterium CCMM004]